MDANFLLPGESSGGTFVVPQINLHPIKDAVLQAGDITGIFSIVIAFLLVLFFVDRFS